MQRPTRTWITGPFRHLRSTSATESVRRSGCRSRDVQRASGLFRAVALQPSLTEGRLQNDRPQIYWQVCLRTQHNIVALEERHLKRIADCEHPLNLSISPS